MKMSRAKLFHDQFFREQRLCVVLILQIFLILVPLLVSLPCRIILDRDTLFIPSVLLEDQGVYTCVASTALDAAEAEAQLIVLGKVNFSRCGNSSLQQELPLQHFCCFASFHRASITQFHRASHSLSCAVPYLWEQRC